MLEFEELYRRYFPRILGLACRFVRDRNAAEDIAQETFVRVLRALDRVDGARPMWPWLETIAIRISIDFQRRRVRMEETVPSVSEFDRQGVPADNTDLERDLPPAVAAALRRLPPRSRRLLALKSEGRSYEEIAKLEGVTVQALKSTLARARRKLRADVALTGPSRVDINLTPRSRGSRTIRDMSRQLSAE